MQIAAFKPIHKYKLNLGQKKGDYKLFFDFDPEGKGYAIPCRVVLEWNTVQLDTGFRGDSSYNRELIDLGYNQVSSDVFSGLLTLFKDKEFPATAELTIYTPIEESLVSISLICPQPTVLGASINQELSSSLNKTIHSVECDSNTECTNIRAYFIKPSFDINEELYTPDSCSISFNSLAVENLTNIPLILNVKTLGETIISIAYDSSYSGVSCTLRHPLIQDLEVILSNSDAEVTI